jgi:hypothetical protein
MMHFYRKKLVGGVVIVVNELAQAIRFIPHLKLMVVLLMLLVGGNAEAAEKKLPNNFWLRCHTLDGIPVVKHLINIDRNKKIANYKLPGVGKLLVCKDNKDEVLLKRNCKKGIDGITFNKWDGSLFLGFRRAMCQILTKDQKPLYC